MNIREFALTDYEAVIKVWIEAGLTIKPSDELPELTKKLERDHDLFLIAEEQGQIIAVVIGAWDGRYGWIYHLAVSPLVQRQGIGMQLMEEVEKRLRQRGALEIKLLVEGRNAQVIPFYQRLGFQIGDKVFMSKSLIDCQLYATLCK
jgi:ribosomal protein S18 acetylase RimI-like enzyme